MPTVLIVDDEPFLLDALKRQLRAERDLTVVTACSAEEALAVLAARAVDVLVTDRHMPGIDGETLLRRMREERPGLRRVLLTGSAALPTDSVAHVVLPKPCARSDLVASIRGPA